MPHRRSTMWVLAGALLLAAAGGFVAFASAVRGFVPATEPLADGIVVLTGTDDRIDVGLGLLARKRAQRLLISGVHPAHRTPAELLRRLGERDPAFACCVDIGHLALNTVGNAEEASRWARERGFRSLIVVTSSFHMPRSLVEFARVMPGVALVAHPVPSRYLHLEAWWLDRGTARTLATEYVKLIVSSARFGLSRLTAGLETVTGARRSASLNSGL